MAKQHQTKIIQRTQGKKEKENVRTLSRMQEIKKFLVEANQEFFTVMLITYLLLLLLEELKEGFVGDYFNLNIVLVITLASGVITAFQKKAEPPREKEALTRNDYIYIFLLGIAGAVIILFKTKELGYLSYVISAISGILIILLSILLLSEEDTSNPE